LKIIYQDDFEREYKHLIDKVPQWEDSRKVVLLDIDPAVYEARRCRCGKEFLVRRSSAKRGLYCSRGCSNRYKWEAPHEYHRRVPMKIKCGWCGVSFLSKERKKFCSHPCYANSLRGKHHGR
jgi:hypothetical protein